MPSLTGLGTISDLPPGLTPRATVVPPCGLAFPFSLGSSSPPQALSGEFRNSLCRTRMRVAARALATVLALGSPPDTSMPTMKTKELPRDCL